MAKIGEWKKQHQNNTKTLMQWSNFAPERRGGRPKHLLYSWDASIGRWVKLSTVDNTIVGYFSTKKAVIDDATKYMKAHPRGM
jgi:hypothetical protein